MKITTVLVQKVYKLSESRASSRSMPGKSTKQYPNGGLMEMSPMVESLFNKKNIN